MSASDLLNMSDEDFLKNPPKSEVVDPVEKVDAAVVAPLTEAAEPVVTTQAEPVQPPKGKDDKVIVPPAKDKPTGVVEPVSETVVETKPKPKVVKAKTADDDESGEDGTNGGEDEGETVDGKEEAAGGPDYEALYKQVMLPFKANGRTIELKTPDEAIQLMQMGANYTKKMQELVPHRKVLAMLQNNGLMDEGKLTYLIDLDKKNPEAIKKLIKEAGLDPQEIDTSVEPAYREGNHRVSDDEVAFHSALEDMKSTPDRVGTLKVINDNWDQASKDALWKSPDIMSIIHGQRETGVYDRIAAEVHRRQTLGSIPTSVPFLQAYKVVGDQMTAADAFKDLISKPVPPAKTPVVVATRVAAPKPALTNGARAAAASTTRQAPAASAKVASNPLAMSDEDFLKQMAGRV